MTNSNYNHFNYGSANLQPEQFRLTQAELTQERFARKLTSRLSDGTDALPHDLAERLRVARQQAVAKRKPALVTASNVSHSGGAAVLGRGGEEFGWWNTIASAFPLIALVVGLFVISGLQNDNRAREVAEVDAALLTDDLPPSAYTDPGFAQFLKARREMGQ